MAGVRNRHPLCSRCQGGALTCLDYSGWKALVDCMIGDSSQAQRLACQGQA